MVDEAELRRQVEERIEDQRRHGRAARNMGRERYADECIGQVWGLELVLRWLDELERRES